MSYINLTYLKNITHNNEVLIKKMIHSYIQDTPQAMIRMEEASRQQQWEEVASIAHEMQSSAGIVGNEALRKELKNLEDNIRNNGKTGLDEMVKQVSQIHQLSLVEIKRSADGMS